jgi:hypothetical protein
MAWPIGVEKRLEGVCRYMCDVSYRLIFPNLEVVLRCEIQG